MAHSWDKGDKPWAWLGTNEAQSKEAMPHSLCPGGPQPLSGSTELGAQHKAGEGGPGQLAGSQARHLQRESALQCLVEGKTIIQNRLEL